MSKNIDKQIAALASWEQTPDRRARTTPGAKAFRASFEQKADPDGILDPAERRRRADQMYRAHMKKLAAKSLKARRAKGMIR